MVDLGTDPAAHLTGLDLQAHIGELERRMREAAADLEFEEAARLRDEIRRLEEGELGIQQPGASHSARTGPRLAPQKRNLREEKRRLASRGRQPRRL
jgi:excinuclease ABC subunit B